MTVATANLGELLRLVEGSLPLTAAVAILSLIGLLKLVQSVINVLKFLYVYFLRPGLNAKKFGPWAVVTGSTDGIGKAYCIELAKRGVNILLVSRTELKLREFSQELETKYKVQTKFVAVDLVQPTVESWKELEDTIGSLEVGLLINNAGLSYSHFEFTDVLDEKEMNDIIAINIVSLTKLCRLVLPGMKKRKRGFIVNLGSGSGLIPFCPYLSVYAGTKSYVNAFSRAMDAEYRRFGVRVQCQAPFFVATKLAKIRKPRLDAPSPQGFAKSSLKQIGFEATSMGFWVHQLMFNVLTSLPVSIASKYIHDMHYSLLKKYYKKLAQQTKSE